MLKSGGDAEIKLLQDQYLQYLKTVPMEYKAFLIAQDHLGSSFELGRSNGFQEWMRQRTKSNLG
jgi:hypothetical protein